MSSETSDNINIEAFYIECPHCDGYVRIEELNCCIFRHGIYKNTNEQIDPHASKEICDALVKNGEIYGCGKPFIIKKINNNYHALKCDYI